MTSIPPAPYFPAPWQLQGEGVIMVFRFPKSWVLEHAGLKEEEKKTFKGGLGYVMLVNYQQSPVGPYKELLFIPGKFGPEGRQRITRIYVDSESSTQNGRFNWGIPKETVPIFWEKNGRTEEIGVGHPEDPVLFCKIKNGLFPLPVSTKILPIHLKQEWEGKTFFTDPSGSGWGKIAKLESVSVNQTHFPDFSGFLPLLCVKVNPFRMHFPASTTCP